MKGGGGDDFDDSVKFIIFQFDTKSVFTRKLSWMRFFSVKRFRGGSIGKYLITHLVRYEVC